MSDESKHIIMGTDFSGIVEAAGKQKPLLFYKKL